MLTESTSFHPVDAAWPDQPADAGVLRAGGVAVPIRDAVVAATDGAELFLGDDIPVRKGTEGWAFLVAHLVDDDAAIAEGDEIEIESDASVRAALSIGHTACHVASLALNRALAGNWSKPAREDALGSPDFDGIAIATSRIEPNGSTDTYRLNKSLRRAGFDTAAVAADVLDTLAASRRGDARRMGRRGRRRRHRSRRRRAHRPAVLGVRAARRHRPDPLRRNARGGSSPSSAACRCDSSSATTPEPRC